MAQGVGPEFKPQYHKKKKKYKSAEAHKEFTDTFFLSFFFFFPVLGIKPKAPQMLGNYSTT
jgi:hypothetical protein